MKKAILTIGLFSLVMILTSFTTPETTTVLRVDNNTIVDLAGNQAVGGNKKVDLAGNQAVGGNKKVDLAGNQAVGGNKKVD
ncbi:3-oxoacyl-ACP reductase [Flavobacterium yafengii]|uniref:3-oxoacyl-ACP reductase n=1 Tax=Flavobacterium yafengii TaxID=3041253 RepID=UPI0024A7F54F|nr:3-oxoacyl-ACP reductase [Flavobacterium yafengii]MDI6045352.1 3-oxoacyl-ACP reductase [Flavobacterium yafengii]